eukprot:440146_1
MLLLVLLSSLSISNSIDVAVLSIKRLRTNPTIQWYTTMNDSIVTITLVGPADRWFSIGIGNTVMDSTYAFVVDEEGTLTERKLNHHNTGDMLPTVATDLEYTETALNGIRTVEITRLRTGYSDLFYTFPNGRSTVGIIAAWSHQPGLAFEWGHSNTTRLSSTTDFLLGNETTPDPTAAPTLAPTTAPTLAPTRAPSLAPTFSPTLAPTGAPTQAFENRYDLWGVTTLGGYQLDNITVVIGVEHDTDTMFINITGPTAQWFAVGFGSGTQMRDKYAIVVDWTPQTNALSLIEDDDIYEHFLGHHVVNIETALDKFVQRKVQFDTGSSFRRNVLLERKIFKATDEDGQYFNFSKCNKRYSLVWARGEYSAKQAKFFGSAHTSSNRGSGSIWIEGEGFDNCNRG